MWYFTNVAALEFDIVSVALYFCITYGRGGWLMVGGLRVAWVLVFGIIFDLDDPYLELASLYGHVTMRLVCKNLISLGK